MPWGARPVWIVSLTSFCPMSMIEMLPATLAV
jgi:hypothetical protein